MWASILNSIYREFLRTSLSGIHKLAATVQGRKGAFILVERYGKRKIGGPYRSLVTLERGIQRYGMRMLRGLVPPTSPQVRRPR